MNNLSVVVFHFFHLSLYVIEGKQIPWAFIIQKWNFKPVICYDHVTPHFTHCELAI